MPALASPSQHPGDSADAPPSVLALFSASALALYMQLLPAAFWEQIQIDLGNLLHELPRLGERAQALLYF